MAKITTREQAIEQGKADGFEAVQDFLGEINPETGEPEHDRADIHGVAYGQGSDWSTPAINAGAARTVGVPGEHEAAYYEAYQAEALKAAREAYDAAESAGTPFRGMFESSS